MVHISINAGLKPVNINYVWGMNVAAAQTWTPTSAGRATLLLGMPARLFFLTHLVLKKLMPASSPSDLQTEI